MSNRLEEQFNQAYQAFVMQLTEYVLAIFDREMIDDSWEDDMIAFFLSLYHLTFEDEVLSVLQDTNVMYDEDIIDDVMALEAHISALDDDNTRLRHIIRRNFQKLLESVRELKSSSEIGLEETREQFLAASLYILVRLANSEIHMTQEEASVDAGVAVEIVATKKLQELTGNKKAKVTIYKIWNAHMDERTCETCIAMDGTRVRMNEAFVDKFTGLYAGLGYTEGRITYAHPNCRCWVTYEAEESTI